MTLLAPQAMPEKVFLELSQFGSRRSVVQNPLTQAELSTKFCRVSVPYGT
jgi:hypothetical protein